MQNTKKFFGSKKAILGLFAVLTLLLSIPLIVMLMREEQDQRQFASEAKTVRDEIK